MNSTEEEQRVIHVPSTQYCLEYCTVCEGTVDQLARSSILTERIPKSFQGKNYQGTTWKAMKKIDKTEEDIAQMRIENWKIKSENRKEQREQDEPRAYTARTAD